MVAGHVVPVPSYHFDRALTAKRNSKGSPNRIVKARRPTFSSISARDYTQAVQVLPCTDIPLQYWYNNRTDIQARSQLSRLGAGHVDTSLCGLISKILQDVVVDSDGEDLGGSYIGRGLETRRIVLE